MSPETRPSKTNGSVPFTDVQQAELRAIQNAFPGAKQDQLVGLAFSGGGIRSATFGLGVLEGLKQLGLLNKIHYLSTVSGGGYIGSWFSANCRRAVDRGDQRDWRSPDADWSKSIQYLRDYSNYLSPNVGFFSADTWSMFTIWCRNALLVQLTIAVAVACLLLVPRLAGYIFGIWPDARGWRWTSVVLFIISIAGIAGNLQQVSTARPNSWRTRLLRKDRALPGLALAAVFGLAAWQVCRTYSFDPFGLPPVNVRLSMLVAALSVASGYCLLPAGVAVYDRFARGTYTQVNYGQAHVQWFIVVPLLACSFFFGAILWHLSNDAALDQMKTYGGLFLGAWSVWPFPLSVAFASLWGLAFASIEQWKVKGPFVALVAAGGSLIVLHALLCAIVLLLRSWEIDSTAHAFVVAPVMVLYAFSLTIVVLIGLVGRQSLEGVREWWSRLGAWLLIYGAAWVIVTVAAVYGPLFVYAITDRSWISLPSAAGWAATVLSGLAAGHSDQTGRDEARKARSPLREIVALVAPFLFIAGLLIGVATLADLIIEANSVDTPWNQLAGANGRTVATVSLFVLAACAFVLGLLAWRTDINVFSLNAFYRNRIVRAYLGATRLTNRHTPKADPPPDPRTPQNFTGFDEKDDVPLADLIGDTPLAGPLHIVNCALNLGGSRDLSLHTRHSASFTLSPLYAGSDYQHVDVFGKAAPIGYVPTAQYGGRREETTLGKAVSVSGAAASPNMGYHTSPVVSFLLTIFNLRLGWWFANPAKNYARKAPHFNLRYMILELFGSATAQSKFLMVSDGGHFENLAVYELIKRRCKVIIASDGECDPAMSFEGLGSLIRMCEVDFNVKIKIDVGSLRPVAGSSWSEQRCAVGTIDYGDDDMGYLVYLKASMTGHEPTAVLQYKTRHPHFPHETTGDQFYAEDQFESYRHLGADVTCNAFDAAMAAVRSDDMVALAATLAQTNAPTLKHVDNFTRHTQALISLWDKLQKSDDLRSLDRGLFGTTADTATPTGARLRSYTCVEMLQLMENVYLDLRLDDTWDHADNSGWRTLFTNWAALDEVRETWQKTSHLYGVRFGYFCARYLKLPRADEPA